ncbi:ubiquitin-related domain-containing protein [Mucidula mucida]|nr:ubiquitin-related domain-containing protein [Mucidula mucida]
MNFDPAYTVGRVKELVWNTWPGDWQDERPPAPSFLRILHLGKVLQDEDILKGANFPIDAPPTIVHMSIRPGALADDLSKKGEEEVVCCCIIC